MSATNTAITVLLILLLAIGISFYKTIPHHLAREHFNVESRNPDRKGIAEHKVYVPVRKDGVIFISDGAKGTARDAAIELSKHGYHVLIGCKTESEIRSFAFDSRKGMEMIKFDISSPETYIPLVYRLRQIQRDLDRRLVGVVINLAEYIEDYSAEPSSSYLDIVYLDRHYKALFKSPARLLQTVFELIKHQHAEASAPLLLSHNGTSGEGSRTAINTNGLRISTLYGEYALPEGMAADSSDYISLCGSKCDIQASFLNYLTGFSITDTQFSNFTASNIRIPIDARKPKNDVLEGQLNPQVDLISPRGEKNYENSILAWRMKQIERYVHNHIKWVKDGKDVLDEQFIPEDGIGRKESRDKLSIQVKAILHSFLSPYPLALYN